MLGWAYSPRVVPHFYSVPSGGFGSHLYTATTWRPCGRGSNGLDLPTLMSLTIEGFAFPSPLDYIISQTSRLVNTFF